MADLMITSTVQKINSQVLDQTPRAYLLMKRLQDILLSGTALLLLWPFLLLIAVLIIWDSPGAAPIFSQVRIGKNGKPFRFYKFRSMCPDAENLKQDLLPLNEMDGPVFKIKKDPRITRVGHILRKTGMDELPQLWNILRGEMSIVGPRPALPDEVEQYDEHSCRRLSVMPGLTCYWQIKPQRNELSFQEWIRLDLKYIQERSFLTDWKIICLTVPTILSMTGE